MPAITAAQKLQLSQLDQKRVQQELMGDDLDLAGIVLMFKNIIKFDSTDRVIDCVPTRTIDGSSTMVLTLDDYDRSILQSGSLNSKLDVEIDGIWFRLVQVARDKGSGVSQLELTFEQREIAVLRSYPKPGAKHNGIKFAFRSKTTRAEFVLGLIREVKEFIIPVIIPELHKPQPIQKASDLGAANPLPVGGGNGIPMNWNESGQSSVTVGGSSLLPGFGNPITLTGPGKLRVKGVVATREQLNNANIICDVGQSMGARRKVIVCAIMTAITESTLHNYAGGDLDSVGLFQQRNSWGSYADRHDPAAAAKMFYNRAIPEDAQNPEFAYGVICQDVQHSAYPDRYQLYLTEADRIVTAYGMPGGDQTATASAANNMGGSSKAGSGASDPYFFYRGIPKDGTKVWQREDSWTCIGRLAEEVGYRAFFAGGRFYFISDDDLFKMQPIMTITEESQGVEGIGFDYDSGKKTATVDLDARVGIWLAPPGAIAVLQQMGPVNGRWLVNSFTRSIFNSLATITMEKPQPVLPEPLDNTIQGMPSWALTQLNAPTVPGEPGSQSVFGGPLNGDGSRNAVVQAAKLALTDQNKHNGWVYYQKRPIPDTLFSISARSYGIDCSAFATLCYKDAGAPDPNNNGYNGAGNTRTLVNNGIPVQIPSPGDLVFYHGSYAFPGHVAVAVDGGMVISQGGPDGVYGPNTYPWQGDSPVVAIRSYLPR